MAANKSVHQQVVIIVSDYLGPAAERFVDRQVQNHLKKEPSKMSKRDLAKIIDWLKISFAFLTEDRALIDELAKRLTALARDKPRTRLKP